MTGKDIGTLSPHFQADYARLTRDRLKATEPVIRTADASFVGKWDRWSRSWLNLPLFGYWVLTTERLFRVWFTPDFGFLSNRGVFKEKVRGSSVDELGVVPPPTFRLTRKEQASREVKETRVTRVVDVSFDVREWRSARLFMVSLVLAPHAEVEAAFWREEDARPFYEVLRGVRRNPDQRRTGGGSDAPSLTELIEALGQLHRSGVLTNDEFDQKKKQLLDRI